MPILTRVSQLNDRAASRPSGLHKRVGQCAAQLRGRRHTAAEQGHDQPCSIVVGGRPRLDPSLTAKSRKRVGENAKLVGVGNAAEGHRLSSLVRAKA